LDTDKEVGVQIKQIITKYVAILKCIKAANKSFQKWRVKFLWNESKKTKLRSERNQDQINFRKCLLPKGSQFLVSEPKM
jgi:hypothetical protein